MTSILYGVVLMECSAGTSYILLSMVSLWRQGYYQRLNFKVTVVTPVLQLETVH